MRISFNQTTSDKVAAHNGYGYAAQMCKESLNTLGHEVSWRDPTADVEINFIQPDHWHWTGPYRIGYLPWESTEFHPGWVDKMNDCDEVWTPSPLIAQWMVDAGVKKEPRVYQHGVDRVWRQGAQKRSSNATFEVLHHGAEALRKGGNDAIFAFLDTLGDKKARLTLKMILNQWNVHDTGSIRILKKKMDFKDLVALYQASHLLCYPSWGEGFGLAPLQAMASGMPVLITKGWAPYEYLLDETSLIDSTLVDSPWPHIHPGQVLQPDPDDLRDKLTYHFENRPVEVEKAWNKTGVVLSDYDWVALTEQAFSHLK